MSRERWMILVLAGLSVILGILFSFSVSGLQASYRNHRLPRLIRTSRFDTRASSRPR